MKKTITINLVGRSFYIEEGAYNMLDEYLRTLKNYFYQDDPEGEIVADLEERIAEHFTQKTKLGYEVITVEVVNEVLKQVGYVEEIVDDLDPEREGAHATETDTSAEETTEAPTGINQGKSNKHRKLYRDPLDCWLAGVMGGLKYYLKVDPIVLRILFILLLFTPVGGPLVLIYIAFAIFVPKAKTVEQRLEMEGKAVTPENIWDKIAEESQLLKQSSSTPPKETPSADSESANIVTEETKEKEKENKPKGKNTKVMWWIFGILALLFTAGSIFWVVQYSIGGFGMPFWEWQELGREFMSAGAGWSMFLFFFSCLFLLVLILCIGLAIILLPIGLILRANTTPLIKLALLLLLVIVVCAILVMG